MGGLGSVVGKINGKRSMTSTRGGTATGGCRRSCRRLGFAAGISRLGAVAATTTTTALTTGCGGRRCGAATLEISGVPARALELETGCGQLFFEAAATTTRTIRERCVRHFLQHVLGKPAGLAFISVNWHGDRTRGQLAKPVIIGRWPRLEDSQAGPELHHQQAQYKTETAIQQALQQPVGAFLFGQQIRHQAVGLRLAAL